MRNQNLMICIRLFSHRMYNVISLNAAVFAAVCLASLMNTALDGFVIVSLSFAIFAFAPKLHKVSNLCIPCYLIVSLKNSLENAFLVGITLILLLTISPIALMMFLITNFLILIVFPLWLYILQGYKK